MRKDGKGMYCITDMVRATIVVSNKDQLRSCFGQIKDLPEFRITKAKNIFISNLQNLVINVIYKDMIIGEIQINCGSKPIS